MFREADYLSDAGAIDSDLSLLAAGVFRRVFRTDLQAPGFALIRPDADTPSRGLRRLMLSLAGELSRLYAARFGAALAYLSAGRFDQQVTTKFHLDGGPTRSFLMLGYEPTPVESRVAVADYTQAAYEMGITPAEFLDRHNPMFTPGAERLAPYVTPLTAFDHSRPQILLVNNSAEAYEPGLDRSLGVMHQAAVGSPSPQARRVVNSVMLAPEGAAERTLTAAEVEAFATTDEVAKRYGG